MTTAPLFDMVQMTVTGAPGTGTITLNAATPGYQTFAAAGAANGDIVSYNATDVNNAWEVGHGTYNSAGPTISNRVMTFSSTGSLISLTSAAIVTNALLVGDLAGAVISDVTTIYTSSGAINLTDTLSMLNSSSALAMTVANGSTTAVQLTIHNIGSGVATVSGTIESGSNSVTLLGNPNGADLVLRWLPSLSTWIIT